MLSHHSRGNIGNFDLAMNSRTVPKTSRSKFDEIWDYLSTLYICLEKCPHLLNESHFNNFTMKTASAHILSVPAPKRHEDMEVGWMTRARRLVGCSLFGKYNISFYSHEQLKSLFWYDLRYPLASNFLCRLKLEPRSSGEQWQRGSLGSCHDPGLHWCD